jgi:hypothetical protein
MMSDGLMWGMGIWWLVIAVLVLLAIAALLNISSFAREARATRLRPV